MQKCGHLNGGHTFLFPFYSKSRVQDTRLGVNLGNNGYSYDAMGRIVANTYTAKDGSSNYRTYTYDEFGQLVRENNEALDKTFVYEYNNIGNVTKVKEYDFTLNTTPTGVLRERNYSYDSASPDKLAAVNGNAIQYNSLGCPVRCGDKVLVWDKGRLMRVYDDVDTSFGYSAEDVRFTYDGQGRRLTKTYTYDPGEDYSGDFCIGRDTAYTYDGDGRLIREYTTEHYTESASTTRELIFLYDEGGVVGVTYSFNGATPVTYYYHKNLQGDVIAIYDEGGNIKAGYAYDAWGNHVVTNDNLPQLAMYNPFRYRGYYYDVETQLYWLSSRYYSPKLCRFISPDDVEYLDPESINGLNLYAYCNNDPVMYSDGSGHAPEWLGNLLIAGAGVLLIAGLAIATIATGGAAAGVAGAIFTGALKGALIGAAIGTVAGGAIGYAVDGVDGMWTGMAIGFTGGAVIGAVIGGTIGGVNYSPLKAASNAANKAIPSKGFNINKHLSTAGGKYSKFNLDSSDDILRMVQNGLKGQKVTFGPNTSAKSWQVIVDMGTQIGTKGQSLVKVIIGYGGKIWTMFPV